MLPTAGVVTGKRRQHTRRTDDRIIIHFDYDCFYASVFEAENPALKALPLAVQQKQIIVTCNYEARRRGLYKLQLIREAKKICPDVIIVLGEDISRFRDASKELYGFLRSFSWNGRVERLGFDEVWMDVTDMVDYNVGLLNTRGMGDSFFCLSKQDPTAGFAFDASQLAGHAWPAELIAHASSGSQLMQDEERALSLRLQLGSHLALWLRKQLEETKGYTSTVGISTSKLLSKLVGNEHKPHSQTTLVPPYVRAATATEDEEDDGSNVTSFIDAHEVGKIPGIGFKLATKIRAHVLQRDIVYDPGLVTGKTADKVTCRQARLCANMSAETLERILAGPGSPHGIGAKVWDLLHGIDNSDVGPAREVPRQISIEDSYIRLDTMDEVVKELGVLSRSLIRRMHADLLRDDDDVEPLADADGDGVHEDTVRHRAWLAHPRTIRLSTRPRLSTYNPDGGRSRSFARTSRSAPLPTQVFSLSSSIDALADRLVADTLVPMFRALHPQKSGWNLSLVNVAVTNMAEAAGAGIGGGSAGVGRDIAKMFKHQDEVLKPWNVEDRDEPPDPISQPAVSAGNGEEDVGSGGRRPAAASGSEDHLRPTQDSSLDGNGWASGSDGDGDVDEDADTAICAACGSRMPGWALAAHERFHAAGAVD